MAEVIRRLPSTETWHGPVPPQPLPPAREFIAAAGLGAEAPLRTVVQADAGGCSG